MASTYELIIQAVDRTRQPLKNIERGMDRLDRKAGQVTSTLKGAGVAIAAFASGSVVRGLISQYTAFERARSVIATYTGSQEKANRELVRLQKLANELAQDLPDITNAFKILTTRGIDTSSESLRAFSNVATANSKSFSQLGEAIADALTGEFERLKEFGIKATKENDKVIAQFADGSKKSFNSYKDFVEGVKQLGTAEGLFGKASINNANTLAQAFSNLAGKYNEAAIEFGKGAEGGLKTFTQTVILLIDQNKELIRQIGQLVGDIATGLAKALAFAANNADKLVLAVKVLVALKVGAWMTTAAVATLRFSKALTATGLAAAKTGKLLKRNIIGLVLAGGVAIADMTGLLDKLFDSTEGDGESNGLNTLLGQLRTVTQELEQYKQGGSTVGKALASASFPLAEVLANESIALTENIKLLERKYASELASGKINVDTIKQLNQQKASLQEVNGALSEFATSAEKASGALRVEISEAANEKELQALNALIAKVREKAALDALNIKVINELNKAKELGTITDKEHAAVLKLINGEKKTELTFQQQLVKSYQDGKKKLDEMNSALMNLDDISKQTGISVGVLREQIYAARDANEYWRDSSKTTAQTIQEGFRTAVNSLPKELSTAIVKGENLFKTLENSFNRMLENILQQILESQIQNALTELFTPKSGGSGGGLTSLLSSAASYLFGAPGKAVGGPVAAGQPYVVGERGPEMFMPNTAGSIVSNSELNSGGGGAVINFNINSIDTQTGVEFLLENKKNIIGMVSQGFNQRGRQGITS